jgi:hypothetical protein
VGQENSRLFHVPELPTIFTTYLLPYPVYMRRFSGCLDESTFRMIIAIRSMKLTALRYIKHSDIDIGAKNANLKLHNPTMRLAVCKLRG